MIHSRPILLIEDNADDELLTIRTLRRANVANEIVVMRNGEEALAYFAQLEAEGDPYALPSVVLLDLKLPKVDGLQVLAALRSRAFSRLLPVVILTSSSEERDIVESYSLGANSYVRKPVEATQFAEAVRQLGVYWLLINQPPSPKG